MPKGFNLSANLVLAGPTNIKPIVAQIRRQIGTINASVQLKFDPKANKNANILAQNVGKLSTSLNALTNSATSSASAIDGLSKAFSNFQRVNSSTISTLTSTGKAVNKISVASQQAGNTFNKFGKEAALAVKRFAAYTIVTAGVFGFVNAIGKAVGEAIDFQHELVKIAQVSGKSTKQLQGLVDEVSRLSTDLGVSSKQLINVAQILAQAGLSADDTKISLEALAKSSLAPTFKDIENTTEGAIAAMAQFKIKAVDLESVLGSVNAVSAAFAVESEDLISVIRRAGGAFAAAGSGLGNFGTQSERGVRQLQELSALFTSVRATTRESADSIATGLRTIFTRVQRGSTIEFLKQFNIQLAESGKFVGQFEAFKRLSEGLKDLDTRDIRFSSIIEELGGFRQVSKVIPLLKNFAIAEDALGVAIGGQTSLTKDASTAQESIQIQISKTREKFLELIRDISQTGTFKAITQGVLSLANGFITLATYLKPVIPLITTLFAIKGFQALRQFTSGFTGAFRGVTANQLGQNAGSTVAGTGGGTAAAATATLATSQSLLKNAILANTYAINSLTNIIGSSRLGGGRSPKFGPGFARGGVVPGSGNTDSVPAMLMPGEFVIRKKAVEALGTERLHAANKFGKGGPQKKKKRKTLFQPGLSKSPDALTFGSIFIDDGTNDNNYTPFKAEQNIKIPGSALGKGRKAVNVNLISSSLSKQAYNNVVNTIDAPIRQLISDVALDISGGLSDIGSIGTIPNLNAIQGSIFEGAVASLGAPIGNIGDDQRTFDYPGGLKSASYLFDSRLTDAPTDAKRTYNRDALRSIRSKIIRSLSDTGKPKAEAAKALSTSELDLLRATGKELSPADVGRILKRKVTGAELNPFFVRRGKFKFASGGPAGSDSVPAMLTPGEFVLRKEAAQKLGRGTLNDLNNADKVQRFAKGGGVARHGRMFYGEKQIPTSAFSIAELDSVVKQLKLEFLNAGGELNDFADILLRVNTIVAQQGTTKINDKQVKPILDAKATLAKAKADREEEKKKNNAKFDATLGNTVLSGKPKQRRKSAVEEALDERDEKLAAGVSRTSDQIGADFANRKQSRFQRISSGVQNRVGGAFGKVKGFFAGSSGGPNAGPLTPQQIASNKQLGEERKQTALFAASTIASLATQFIPQTTQTGAGLAGGISGLSQGAALGGSIGGAPGAVIGGVIGGLTGVVTSLDEFNKSKALKALEESTTKLDTAFANLNDGVITLQDRMELVAATEGVSSATKQTFNADKNSNVNFLSRNAGGIVSRISGVNNIAGLAGKEASKVADTYFQDVFDTISQPDALQGIFAGKTGTQIAEERNAQRINDESNLFKPVADTISKSIKAGVDRNTLGIESRAALVKGGGFLKEKARKAGATSVDEFIKTSEGQNALSKAYEIESKRLAEQGDKERAAKSKVESALNRLSNTLDQTAKEFADMTARIDLSTQDFQASRGVKQARINALGGNFSFAGAEDTQGNVRALSNIDALSKDELTRVTNSVAGRNATLQDAAKSVQDSQQIKNVLDNVIGGLQLQNFAEGSDIEGQVKNALLAQGVDIQSTEVKDILENINESLNANRQGETQDKVLKKILNETLSGQLGTTSSKALGLLSSSARDTSTRRDEFARSQDEATNVIVGRVNKQLEVQALSNDANVKRRSLSGGLPASLDELNKGFSDELKSLAGTDSIAKISKDFITLQRGLATGVIPRNAESAAKAKLLGQALQKAATSSDKYNNAVTKLAEEKAKGSFLNDAFSKVIFGNPQDIAKGVEGAKLEQQIKSGNFGAIDKTNVRLLGEELPNILERIKLFEGEDAAKKFELDSKVAAGRAVGINENSIQLMIKTLQTQQEKENKAKSAADQALKDQVTAAQTQLEAAKIQERIALRFAQPGDFINQAVKKNSGGIIPGGGPNRDSVLAHLTPGEFVVNRNATRNNLGLLKKINGYNSGGKVSGSSAIGLSDNSVNSFINGIAQFGRLVEKFSQIKIPEKITMELAPIRNIVTFTGESVLANEVAKQVTQQVQGLVETTVRKFLNPLTGQTNDGLG